MTLVLMPEYYELKVTSAERRIARLSQPLAELNAALEVQQDVIMQLYDDYMKGILDKEEFQAKRDANREQIALLNARIENYNKELQPQQAEVDRYKAWIDAFRDYQAKPELTKAVMDRIIRQVSVDADRNIFIEFLCK